MAQDLCIDQTHAPCTPPQILISGGLPTLNPKSKETRPNAQATNDLDLTTIESVEALLSEYRGVLVVVSHDRQFVECTAERLFVLRGDGLVRLFDGSYSEVRTAADSAAAGDAPTGPCAPLLSASLRSAPLAFPLHSVVVNSRCTRWHMLHGV